MSGMWVFLRKWNECYWVLRYRQGFSLTDSMQYGLWLARG